MCVCSGWIEAMTLIGSDYMLKCIFVCLCFAVSRSYVHAPGPMYVHLCKQVYMVHVQCVMLKGPGIYFFMHHTVISTLVSECDLFEHFPFLFY